MSNQELFSNNPLQGVKLEQVVEELVEQINETCPHVLAGQLDFGIFRRLEYPIASQEHILPINLFEEPFLIDLKWTLCIRLDVHLYIQILNLLSLCR